MTRGCSIGRQHVGRLALLGLAVLAIYGCGGDGNNPAGPEDPGPGDSEPATGSIQVIVGTVGGTDPDGYTVSIDGGAAQSIGVNDSVTITGLSAGVHSVALGDLDQACGLTGQNPRSVTVIGNRTVRVDFAVTCITTTFTGRIVFHSARDGDDEIFVMNADGSNVVQLTQNNLLSDRHPNWSPDGTRIVYAGQVDEPFGNTEIFVMDADGSNKVNLTNSALYDGSPGWSPDGSQIVFETNRDDLNGFPFFNDGDPQEIYIMNDDGTGFTRVTNRLEADIHPDFSPDGTRIAFAADLMSLGTEDVFVMDVDGSNLVNLTNSSGSDLRPAWSPDGARIAFHSDRNGNFDIFVMNADGTGVTQLTSASTNEFSPDWSPDGSAIAFAGRIFGGDDAEIFVMSADGTGVIQLTNNMGIEDNGPSWAD